MKIVSRGSWVCLMASVVLAGGAAWAGDRHVYLDTNGNGQLNDCPNPAHNAKGTSNTDELSYCSGGTSAGKVIGTATGRVSSTTCTSGGGTVAAVTSGLQVDVDGDGTKEFVYRHPQACVWNMAKSDSCEIHAGTYSTAGAYADADSLDSGFASGAGCDKQNCWWATVVAYGYGPNLGTSGYGTAAAPAYLRGAVMNGSTDTWDSDGDKIPDTESGEPQSYPARFSGDLNKNGVFDETVCDDSSCTGGDAYYAVQVGCNKDSYSFCKTNNTDDVKVDINGSNAYTTKINSGNRAVDYFVIKDLEVTGYNGGHSYGTTGTRAREGMIALEGIGDTEGLVVDHVYVHDNDFSLMPSKENYWSMISDSHNGLCEGHTDIKNSTLVQNNHFIVDDDCGPNVARCGCTKYFFDNRVIVDITSPRASTRSTMGLFYYKNIDATGPTGVPKTPRIYNNEIITKNITSGGGFKLMDLQAFGATPDATPSNLGELWIYGNLFRKTSGSSAKWSRFWSGSCGLGTGSGRVYFFNNSFDMTFNSNTDGIYQVCGSTLSELVVEKNNAYASDATSINTHASPATTRVAKNEYCSVTDTDCVKPSAVARTDWWNYVATPGLYNGLPSYTTKSGGPLYHIAVNNACDPDDDGVVGVDYNGDGVTDTTWRDVAGNTINCPRVDSPIDIGAIQSSSQPPPTDPPPATVEGVTRTDKVP